MTSSENKQGVLSNISQGSKWYHWIFVLIISIGGALLSYMVIDFFVLNTLWLKIAAAVVGFVITFLIVENFKKFFTVIFLIVAIIMFSWWGISKIENFDIPKPYDVVKEKLGVWIALYPIYAISFFDKTENIFIEKELITAGYERDLDDVKDKVKDEVKEQIKDKIDDTIDKAVD